jgi:hypothetical protein
MVAIVPKTLPVLLVLLPLCVSNVYAVEYEEKVTISDDSQSSAPTPRQYSPPSSQPGYSSSAPKNQAPPATPDGSRPKSFGRAVKEDATDAARAAVQEIIRGIGAGISNSMSGTTTGQQGASQSNESSPSSPTEKRGRKKITDY